MTLRFLAGILTFPLLIACKSYKKEFEQVSLERDSLIYAMTLKDSSIHSLLEDLNTIESNLDSITLRQQSIDKAAFETQELKSTRRERINESIRIINELLERNRQLIADLQSRLKNSESRITVLTQLAERLQKRLNEKEQELGILNARLAELQLNLENLNVMMDTLTAQKIRTENELQHRLKQLNTAYYIIGTFNELRQKKIVDKEGGFLGLGKNQLLKPDFNPDDFTSIDIYQLRYIDFGGKQGKLITQHPGHSYSLEKHNGRITALRISDPEKFWSISKYLVIVTN